MFILDPSLCSSQLVQGGRWPSCFSPVSRPSSSGCCLWLPRKMQILFHLSAFPDLRPWVKIAACLAWTLLPAIECLPLVLCSLGTLMRGSGASHRVTSGGNLIPAGFCKACVLPFSLYDRLNVCRQAPRWVEAGRVTVHDQRNLAECSLLKSRGQCLRPSPIVRLTKVILPQHALPGLPLKLMNMYHIYIHICEYLHIHSICRSTAHVDIQRVNSHLHPVA